MSASLTRRLRGQRWTVAWVLAAIVSLEVIVVVVWFAVADWSVLRPAAVAHPLVWINVAVFGLLVVDTPTGTARFRALAAAVAIGYLILIAWIGGVLRPTGGPIELSVLWLPPGWGPAVRVGSPLVGATLFPYQVVGYLTLAYLLYAALLDAVSPVAGALTGLASCIGCTIPLAAVLLGPLVGGTVPLALGGAGRPAALGTIVFAVSVAILLWRPGPAGR
jgi:hypothetical protein